MIGNPDIKHVSTSYIELHRATKPFVSHDDAPLYPPDDTFSKKLKNHSAAVALNYFAYNFLGIHSALRCTWAMAADGG
jgi:hypothetical protein